MNRRWLLKGGAALAVSCAALTACAQQHVTLRYRLKIVARVGERLYEGASVIETEMAYWGEQAVWFRAPEAGSLSSRSWGEAVVIDLAEHGLLFALLYPEDVREGGFNILSAPNTLLSFLPRDERNTAERVEALQDLQGEFNLQESREPTFIRFRDISDPATYEVVDPSQFAATFDPGSALESATISTTRDPITKRIDQVLPWLANAQPGRRLAGRLSLLNFKANGD